MIDAQTMLAMSSEQRGERILQLTALQESNGLEHEKKISRVINTFIVEYLSEKIAIDQARPKGSVLEPDNLHSAFLTEIDEFKSDALETLRKTIPEKSTSFESAHNLWEMAGAKKLALSNKATRQLNTKLGLLWERLARISPYAIAPEEEFNLKIRGIDLIALNRFTKRIEYQQLKTQRNTLTGSQRNRSVDELGIHENPVFCACFTNAAQWTFKHPDIPRVSGEDFWSRIGIPYGLILRVMRGLVLALEEEYVNLLSKGAMDLGAETHRR